jgi:hypothetical protein
MVTALGLGVKWPREEVNYTISKTQFHTCVEWWLSQTQYQPLTVSPTEPTYNARGKIPLKLQGSQRMTQAK